MRNVKAFGEDTLETKVKVLVLGISMLLGGFIVLLFLAYLTPTLVNYGAFAFVVGFLVTFGGFVEIAMDKESLQTSKKKIIAVALIVIVIGLAVPYSVWAIIVPRWSFSITTDKSTYELGEPVQIRVTLQNVGSITHSFTSAVSDPVVVQILIHPHSEVWYSKPNEQTTQFTVSSHQTLERTFTWNQTNTSNPGLWNQTHMPGTYTIKAFIPNPQSEYFLDDPLFRAQTNINITST